MKKKIVFIMNPISGTSSKAAVPSLIDSTLDKELFEYEIRLTERAGHASEIAAEARDNHADIVVAVGGDGTVNEALRFRQWTGTPPALAYELEEEHRGNQCLSDTRP